MSRTEVMPGNYAAAYGIMLIRPKVIAAYPITPGTPIVEKLAEFCSSGQLDAEYVPVESEHSVMAACFGAALSGVRVATATSSHGLALMHEVLFWVSGMRLPVIMVNVNRAMGAPWILWTDQNDSLAQRETGWLQFYCEDNQEVIDTIIQVCKVAEKVSLPAMIVLEGFILSHTAEPVNIPDLELVNKYLPAHQPQFAIDLNDPRTFGGLTQPAEYMEMRYKAQQAMREAIEVAKLAHAEFKEMFGRGYGNGIIEKYRCEDAETLLVTSGTVTGTARTVVDQLKAKGEKVGLLKVKMFRPFPTEDIKEALLGRKRAIVIDRNISLGAQGIFCQEIKAVLCNEKSKPQIFGFIAGLGGKDITDKTLLEIYKTSQTYLEPPESEIWMRGEK